MVMPASVVVECDTGNGYNSADLGLRISSIFVIGLGSSLGGQNFYSVETWREINLMRESRCTSANRCCKNAAHACSAAGLFHNKILRIGCHYRDGFHSCTWSCLASIQAGTVRVTNVNSFLLRLPRPLARHVLKV